MKWIGTDHNYSMKGAELNFCNSFRYLIQELMLKYLQKNICFLEAQLHIEGRLINLSSNDFLQYLDQACAKCAVFLVVAVTFCKKWASAVALFFLQNLKGMS